MSERRLRWLLLRLPAPPTPACQPEVLRTERLAWPAIGRQYLRLAQRVLAEREAAA